MSETVHNFLKRHCISTKKLIICIALLLVGVILSLSGKSGGAETFESDEPVLSRTQTEQKLCDILEKIQGVGIVDVMVTYKDEKSESYFESSYKDDVSRIQGVVVVASGAENDRVKSDIIYAVSALMDVELCNIKVYKQN